MISSEKNNLSLFYFYGHSFALSVTFVGVLDEQCAYGNLEKPIIRKKCLMRNWVLLVKQGANIRLIYIYTDTIIKLNTEFAVRKLLCSILS